MWVKCKQDERAAATYYDIDSRSVKIAVILVKYEDVCYFDYLLCLLPGLQFISHQCLTKYGRILHREESREFLLRFYSRQAW